jgi:predicted metal-dependent HD superfamily phosphohydrolase
MKGYYTLRKIIMERLQNELSKDLHYHGMHHTLDALKTCDLYLRHIKINSHDARLLRLGILFHDIGFTVSNEEHEYKGSIIARDLLTQFGFKTKDIDVIVGLILSTKIPQSPKTLLENMICDIDLDYLGRSDFYEISESLYEELQVTIGLKNKNDWNKIQVKFLEAHKYHTDFAIKKRQPEKEKRINELKKLIEL